MKPTYHLAQVNIAKAHATMDAPEMQGFVEQLDYINQLAERSPGFVWRLQTEAGDATSLQLFDDPLVIMNCSVWESLEALQDYVYSGEHLTVLKNKKNWFEKMASPALALWWVPAGHIPSAEAARDAIHQLQQQGPSAAVFSFAKPYPMPDASQALHCG